MTRRCNRRCTRYWPVRLDRRTQLQSLQKLCQYRLGLLRVLRPHAHGVRAIGGGALFTVAGQTVDDLVVQPGALEFGGQAVAHQVPRQRPSENPHGRQRRLRHLHPVQLGAGAQQEKQGEGLPRFTAGHALAGLAQTRVEWLQHLRQSGQVRQVVIPQQRQRRVG